MRIITPGVSILTMHSVKEVKFYHGYLAKTDLLALKVVMTSRKCLYVSKFQRFLILSIKQSASSSVSFLSDTRSIEPSSSVNSALSYQYHLQA